MTNDDLIKRSDAQQALVDCEDIKGYAYKQMEEAINAIPSADRPQWEWIPCSERLPEKEGEYLVTICAIYFEVFHRFISTLYFNPRTNPNWFGYLNDEIVAWAYLPEPWEGGDNAK